MLALGIMVIWVGYTAIYIGVSRIMNDTRSVRGLFMGTA